MEIGTITISTAEYMELRAIKDNLEARKAEVEANADNVCVTLSGNWFPTMKPKDEVLKALGETADRFEKAYSANVVETSKFLDPAKIDRSPRGRLHILFTGELFKTKW
jgi:uncharacterized protein (DUF2461 family)